MLTVTADWQFAMYASRSKPNARWITSRLADVVEAFEWWVTDSIERGATTGVIAGDLFDNRDKIEVPVLQAVAHCLRFANTRFTEGVHVLAGNHDAYLRDTSITALSMFDVGNDHNLTVHLQPTRIIIGGLSVGFVPWSDDVAQMQEGVRKVKDVDLLFGHALLKGVAGTKGVDPDLFTSGGADMVVLGDVHDRTTIHTSTGDPIQYVGAPLQLNFGDSDGDRGYMLIDDELSETFVDNTISPRFHRCKDRKAVKAVMDDDFVRVDFEVEDGEQLFQDVSVTADYTTPKLDTELARMPELTAQNTDRDIIATYIASDCPTMAGEELASVLTIAEQYMRGESALH